LIEVFLGKLNRDRVVSKIGCRARIRVTDLNGRVQLDTFASGDIREFEPVDASLGEFQSSWDDQAIAGKGTITNNVVRNLHRLWLIE
jgi:hypothetical protein